MFLGLCIAVVALTGAAAFLRHEFNSLDQPDWARAHRRRSVTEVEVHLPNVSLLTRVGAGVGLILLAPFFVGVFVWGYLERVYARVAYGDWYTYTTAAYVRRETARRRAAVRRVRDPRDALAASAASRGSISRITSKGSR